MKKGIIIILMLFFCLNFNTDARAGHTQKIPILLYHHIVPDEDADFFEGKGGVIKLSEFEAQMEYLYMNGFHSVTIQELQDFLYKDKKLPENSVVIHFDDGYYSNILYGYPILKQYSFRAAIFMITGAMTEEQQPYEKERLVFIAQDTMAATTDVFEYASHTHFMHQDAYDGRTKLMVASREEALEDLRTSFQYIGSRNIFAYPKGQYSDDIIQLLATQRVTMAVTVAPEYVTRYSYGFELGRFIISPGMSMEDFIDIVEGRAS